MSETYATATELGDLFGLSAIKICQELAELGLSEGTVPTKTAQVEDLVMRQADESHDTWLWKRDPILTLLEESGLKRIDGRVDFEQASEREQTPAREDIANSTNGSYKVDMFRTLNDSLPLQRVGTLRKIASSFAIPQYKFVKGGIKMRKVKAELVNDIRRELGRSWQNLFRSGRIANSATLCGLEETFEQYRLLQEQKRADKLNSIRVRKDREPPI